MSALCFTHVTAVMTAAQCSCSPGAPQLVAAAHWRVPHRPQQRLQLHERRWGHAAAGAVHGIAAGRLPHDARRRRVRAGTGAGAIGQGAM